MWQRVAVFLPVSTELLPRVFHNSTSAGVGYKMGNELDHMGIKTAADLRQVSQDTLTHKFGERIGTFLQLACRGQVSNLQSPSCWVWNPFLLHALPSACGQEHAQTGRIAHAMDPPSQVPAR